LSPADEHGPLHRGTVAFKQHGVAVELDVLEGVFSSAGVDAGTRHLLRWLASDRYREVRSVLDLGCGYGPLGLWLAAAEPSRTVLAVDRDARALAATGLGAARNRLEARVQVRGSLGYDDLLADERFDLVVSNIPAKVGGDALRHLLLDARAHVAPGGLVAVVVVDRLVPEVDDLLGDDAVELLDRRPSKGYTAYEYRFATEGVTAEPAKAFGRGVYRRGREAFRFGDLGWEADVSYSLPDFDSVGRGTQAALELLTARASTPVRGEAVAFVGVGQGHLPAALRAAGHRGGVRLVDRDLLALRTTTANLPGVAPEVHHVPDLPVELLHGVDLVVVELPEREPVSVTAAVAGRALSGSGGLDVLLHGRSADVSRVLELLRRHGARVEVAARTKAGQHSAVRGRVARTRATPPA
jgi:16S rRNA G1207 methylase RsmC